MTLPRFSLRLLLAAVAVLCAWLAWERSVVMERRAARDRWTESGTIVVDPVADSQLQVNLPWIRRCFGDVAIAGVFISPTHEPEVFDSAKRLFPEAKVEWARIEFSDGTLEIFHLESRDDPFPLDLLPPP